MAATILGLRHAEVHNPGGVIYASLDGFGLSPAGRRQAREAARALRGAAPLAVYASPLERALSTAEAITEQTGAELRIDDRLAEWRHWDAYAGWTWDELRDRAPDAWRAYTTDPGSIGGAESLDALAERVQAWIFDAAAAHGEGLVVGVTHLEPLRAVVSRLLGRPFRSLLDLEVPHAHAVRLAPEPSGEPLAPAALERVL